MFCMMMYIYIQSLQIKFLFCSVPFKLVKEVLRDHCVCLWECFDWSKKKKKGLSLKLSVASFQQH